MSEREPIRVGNVAIYGDFDAHLADTKRRKACLCGSTNDVRRGPALWGYGGVCRRCRKLWSERYGKPWIGEKRGTAGGHPAAAKIRNVSRLR